MHTARTRPANWSSARGHPLAIDVTRAGISGPDGYVKWLERMSGGVVAELDHLGQRVGSLTADHETSISATMALSIERLGGNAVSVLTVSACYAPLPIPLSIIDDIVDDGGLEAIRACELAVDELERASLARVATDDTVTVHRLVQLVVQQLLGVTQELVLAHHEAVAGVIMGLTAEMDQGLVAGPYRHHFELSRSLQMHEETAYALAGWQGLYLLLAGQYSDAALHFQHVLQHYAATLGGADPRTLSAAQYLAVVLDGTWERRRRVRIDAVGLRRLRHLVGRRPPTDVADVDGTWWVAADGRPLRRGDRDRRGGAGGLRTDRRRTADGGGGTGTPGRCVPHGRPTGHCDPALRGVRRVRHPGPRPPPTGSCSTSASRWLPPTAGPIASRKRSRWRPQPPTTWHRCWGHSTPTHDRERRWDGCTWRANVAPKRWQCWRNSLMR